MVRRPFERIGCIRPEGGDGAPGRIIVEGEPFDGELLALSLGHQIQQVLVDFHGHFGLVAQQLYLGRRIEIIDFPAVPQYPAVGFEFRNEGLLIFTQRTAFVERAPIVIGNEMDNAGAPRDFGFKGSCQHVSSGRTAEEQSVGVELQQADIADRVFAGPGTENRVVGNRIGELNLSVSASGYRSRPGIVFLARGQDCDQGQQQDVTYLFHHRILLVVSFQMAIKGGLCPARSALPHSWRFLRSYRRTDSGCGIPSWTRGRRSSNGAGR